MKPVTLLHRTVISLLCFYLIGFSSVSAGQSTLLESFLEPRKQVDVVPVNRDVIQELHVKEGDSVQRGQLLITLNIDVLKAREKTAIILADTRGELVSAQTIVGMRRGLLENLQQLKATGHVRPRELEKAQLELAVAEAELLKAHEQRAIREAELEQIKAQIDEKMIKSPVDGIVTRIYKEEGELVGMSSGDKLVTVVQLDPLQATFYVPAPFSSQFSKGKIVTLLIDGDIGSVQGEIGFISPVVNPESGTVRMKVDLRQNLQARSGMRCRLQLEPDITK